MARVMMVAGNSGMGKTTSVRNLDPKQTFILNCGKKSLPFRGSEKLYTPLAKDNPEGNILNSNKFDDILRTIKYVGEKREEIEYLVIDDMQFAMAESVISKFSEKGFEKFNALAKAIWDTVEYANNQRDNLNIIFILHLENNYNSDGVKETKAKTLGKAIDNMVNLDGLFTTILYAEAFKVDGDMKYIFRTKTNGTDTCKTPMGMFEDEFIENDLALAMSTIREYYEG